MNARPEHGRFTPAESSRFGFADDSDDWMGHLLAATRSELDGSIGPYELIEEISRGGQGVVYRARQPGMNRDIAVKRLIAGAFASRARRRRFEREVEAASALQHPGIVTVYGMEVVDDVPVLAMEWIAGRPITEWAAAEKPDARRILQVFLLLCDAVQHAHRRGVIHCDLKPSNILVDESGHPRVLDFGLARFLEPGADDSLATVEEGFLGTLAYASPEQLEGERESLDVRSDVYSLGIILYELQLGERPYLVQRGAGPDQAADQRRAWIDFPRGRVTRELQAIIRAAIAPRREDRYQSVGNLADDLRRYAGGRPIFARTHGAAYVLWKLISRHRAVSALGAALFVTLAVFLVVTTRQARQLGVERDAEAVARAAAERAAEQAEAVTEFLVTDMLLAVEPKGLGDEVSVGELLGVASERVGVRFAGAPALEARVRRTLADAYQRLGRYPEALAHQEVYLALARRLNPADSIAAAFAELSLAHYLQAVERLPEAIEHFTRVLPVLEAADPIPYPQISRAYRELASCYEQLNDVSRAFPVYEAGLGFVVRCMPDDFGERAALLTGLARLQYKGGDLALARRRYEELLAGWREHEGDDHPQVGYVLSLLSDIDRREGDRDAAREKRRESLRIYENAVGDAHPWIATALGDLADLMDRPDELLEAEQMLRRSIDITRRSRGEESTAEDLQQLRLATNLMLQERHAEASELLEPVVRHFEASLGPALGASLRARSQLINAFIASGRVEDGLSMAQHHLEIIRGSVWADNAGTLSKAYYNVYRAASLLDRWEEALDASNRHLEVVLQDPAQDREQKAETLRQALPIHRQHGDEASIQRWTQQLEALSTGTPSGDGDG